MFEFTSKPLAFVVILNPLVQRNQFMPRDISIFCFIKNYPNNVS